MSICIIRDARIIKRVILINRFLFRWRVFVVVIPWWRREGIAVIVDDLLYAPLLLPIPFLVTRAWVNGLVAFWLIDVEALLLFVVNHHALTFRIHLFGRLVPEWRVRLRYQLRAPRGGWIGDPIKINTKQHKLGLWNVSEVKTKMLWLDRETTSSFNCSSQDKY
jgi:hypothetical protein